MLDMKIKRIKGIDVPMPNKFLHEIRKQKKPSHKVIGECSFEKCFGLNMYVAYIVNIANFKTR